MPSVCSALTQQLGLVTRVDFDKPNAADKVLEWKKVPGAVGLRLGMVKERGLSRGQPRHRAHAEHSGRRIDLPMNFLCWGNIDVGTALIDRFPDDRFVWTTWACCSRATARARGACGRTCPRSVGRYSGPMW